MTAAIALIWGPDILDITKIHYAAWLMGATMLLFAPIDQALEFYIII